MSSLNKPPASTPASSKPAALANVTAIRPFSREPSGSNAVSVSSNIRSRRTRNEHTGMTLCPCVARSASTPPACAPTPRRARSRATSARNISTRVSKGSACGQSFKNAEKPSPFSDAFFSSDAPKSAAAAASGFSADGKTILFSRACEDLGSVCVPLETRASFFAGASHSPSGAKRRRSSRVTSVRSRDAHASAHLSRSTSTASKSSSFVRVISLSRSRTTSVLANAATAFRSPDVKEYTDRASWNSSSSVTSSKCA
mmetsp:Transcript_12247/g.51254  ORF Transcript_12247/g.51254 Transcript_12247/m.51254 type:complete len:257 (-) Transcript_12247:1854-2624(-)